MKGVKVKRLVLLALVALALITAASATAFRNGQFVTISNAEDMVFASDWAQANEIEDVNCEGMDPIQAPSDRKHSATFKNFSCDATYSDESQRGDPMTCTFNLAVHTLPTAGQLQLVGGHVAHCSLDSPYGSSGGYGDDGSQWYSP